MKRWLKEQAIIQELVKNGDLKCSVNLPEFIDSLTLWGMWIRCIDFLIGKMFLLPHQESVHQLPRHHQNLIHRLHPSFPLGKTKEKEKLEKYISLSQKETS
jgi:hypothetical protein